MRVQHTKQRSKNQACREPLSEVDIDRARAVPIEHELEGRGVRLRRQGNDLAGPSPICGTGKDRFQVNPRKQVWISRDTCHGGQGNVIALVQFLDGLDFREAVELLAGVAPAAEKQQHTPITARPPPGPDAEEIIKPNAALVIWHRSVDPCGTLVERYLNNRRKVELSEEAALEAIRFHHRCIDDLPGMVCLVRNIITNDPQGIHRTALAPDGTEIRREGKTLRKSLGTIKDGAIKLDPDEAVTMGVCIGEGVETCLAGWQMGFRPVWSAVNKGGVENFPVLPGLDGLHIFRENEPTARAKKPPRRTRGDGTRPAATLFSSIQTRQKT